MESTLFGVFFFFFFFFFFLSLGSTGQNMGRAHIFVGLYVGDKDKSVGT